MALTKRLVDKIKLMKRLPQTILILLLLIAAVANAEGNTDAYEYATVLTYSSVKTGGLLEISFSNGDFKEVKTDKEDVKPSFDFNQSSALKQVSQMSKEGWETVNFQTYLDPIYGKEWIYFLKRKQNQSK